MGVGTKIKLHFKVYWSEMVNRVVFKEDLKEGMEEALRTVRGSLFQVVGA